MNKNLCICCGDIVPEGRQVYWSCEHNMEKIGLILQSQNATKEEVDMAYNSLNKENKLTKQND